MTKLFLSGLLMVVFFTSNLFASDLDKHSYKPNEGYVPDSMTAIKVAEAILSPIYGQKKIDQEKPLNADLKDGVWLVTGTFYCPDGTLSVPGHTCRGGVLEIEINKDDGKILRVSHGK